MKRARAEGADYIIAAPIYLGFAEEDVVRLKKLRKVKQEASLPLFVSGDSTRDKAPEVIDAAADSVEVVDSSPKTGLAEEASQQITQVYVRSYRL